MEQRALGNVMVTGGCGFIGSHFIRYLLHQETFYGKIINVDKLTYAGNAANLEDVANAFGGTRYEFEWADVCDADRIEQIFQKYQIDTVVHFAAESHVDRSIHGPQEFVETNVVGTARLLDVAVNMWGNRKDVLFHQVGTDEVYGTLGKDGHFTEATCYSPRSPYSATKAAADHLVRAYHHTYGLSVTLSNCSNNYGPYQFPEKLIPLMILNMVEGKQLPVYGNGTNVRDWLYVEDHAAAIWNVLEKGRAGETYVIGGGHESSNIDLVLTLCRIVGEQTGIDPDVFEKLINYVTDRPGHDFRYAIDSTKIRTELKWSPKYTFEQALRATVRWYLSNAEWIASVRSGEYRNWIEQNYHFRGMNT